MAPTGRTVAEAWHAGDVDERRALLSSLLGEPLVIYPASRRVRGGIDAARVGWPEHLEQ